MTFVTPETLQLGVERLAALAPEDQAFAQVRVSLVAPNSTNLIFADQTARRVVAVSS
jgi:hypothetical protein